LPRMASTSRSWSAGPGGETIRRGSMDAPSMSADSADHALSLRPALQRGGEISKITSRSRRPRSWRGAERRRAMSTFRRPRTLGDAIGDAGAARRAVLAFSSGRGSTRPCDPFDLINPTPVSLALGAGLSSAGDWRISFDLWRALGTSFRSASAVWARDLAAHRRSMPQPR
jgi:hypothetical protein